MCVARSVAVYLVRLLLHRIIIDRTMDAIYCGGGGGGITKYPLLIKVGGILCSGAVVVVLHTVLYISPHVKTVYISLHFLTV